MGGGTFGLFLVFIGVTLIVSGARGRGPLLLKALNTPPKGAMK